jgi:hypothetical protein
MPTFRPAPTSALRNSRLRSAAFRFPSRCCRRAHTVEVTTNNLTGTGDWEMRLTISETSGSGPGPEPDPDPEPGDFDWKRYSDGSGVMDRGGRRRGTPSRECGALRPAPARKRTHRATAVHPRFARMRPSPGGLEISRSAVRLVTSTSTWSERPTRRRALTISSAL